jgi:hypothetical protein
MSRRLAVEKGRPVPIQRRGRENASLMGRAAGVSTDSMVYREERITKHSDRRVAQYGSRANRILIRHNVFRAKCQGFLPELML